MKRNAAKTTISSDKSKNAQTKYVKTTKAKPQTSNVALKNCDKQLDKHETKNANTKVSNFFDRDPKLGLPCVVKIARMDATKTNDFAENNLSKSDKRIDVPCIAKVKQMKTTKTNKHITNDENKSVPKRAVKKSSVAKAALSECNHQHHECVHNTKRNNPDFIRGVNFALNNCENVNKENCMSGGNPKCLVQKKITSFKETNNTMPPRPTKKTLRQRQVIKNYHEQSLEESKNQTSPDESKKQPDQKLPVYKRIIEEQTKRKAAGEDLYEFDESDEKTKKKRKARRRKNAQLDDSVDSSLYDKNMKIIMQKLINDVIKKKPKRVRAKAARQVIPNKIAPLKNIVTKSAEYKKAQVLTDNKLKQIDPFDKLKTLPNQNQCTKIAENNNNVANNLEASHDDDNYDDLIEHNDTPLFEESYNNKGAPNLNSTWRFDAAEITRNPHFLQIKNNSLPSVNQEPILNHTLNLNETCNKTPEKVCRSNQKSMLDYVSCANPPKSCSKNLTLFDEGDLSPMKENISPIKNRASKNPVTPKNLSNVLGVSNRVNVISSHVVSTPLQQENVAVQSPNLSIIEADKSGSYFGFGSSREEEPGLGKPEGDEPFRLPPLKAARKIYNKTKNETQQIETSQIEEPENLSDDFPTPVPEDELLKVGLFEEIAAPVKHAKKYTRKKRQWRSVSVESDSEDDDEKSNQKKKKKYQLTKTELEERQKWEKEFNLMCQEVETYELQVE